MPAKKKAAKANDETTGSSGNVEIQTDASATADLSTGEGVGDVKAEDIPNALESTNLPPEVRAELVRNHPVTPGAQPAHSMVKEQPMPVVTGAADGASVNDRPIVQFTSSAHPELVVWHPNGERAIQFHNGEFATANEEWQAVLDRTPEVSRGGEIKQGGGVEINEDGHVVSLAGADVEPIRAADVSA